MKINIHEMKKRAHKFVVIVSKMNDELMMVRHKDRQTYEIPGGHVEEGETLLEAAKRELYEETGAEIFDIWPIGDYSVDDSFGRLYGAEIKTLGELPDMEIAQVIPYHKDMRWTYEAIQPHLLKSAENYDHIREIKEEDAENFKELLMKLDEETNFMMLEPGERQSTVEEMKHRINRMQSSGVTYVIDDNGLKGYISLNTGQFNRNKHSGYIVIGLLQEAAGKKYGTLLFNRLFSYAKTHDLHRLELTVMVTNEAGVHLYKKMGFEVEGIKKDSMKVNGTYVDEYYMSKIMEV